MSTEHLPIIIPPTAVAEAAEEPQRQQAAEGLSSAVDVTANVGGLIDLGSAVVEGVGAVAQGVVQGAGAVLEGVGSALGFLEGLG